MKTIVILLFFSCSLGAMHKTQISPQEKKRIYQREYQESHAKTHNFMQPFDDDFSRSIIFIAMFRHEQSQDLPAHILHPRLSALSDVYSGKAIAG